MTAFVLVPESCTGGAVWDEVAGRLRAAGAEVHPVTLTGMGERQAEAGPDTDLDTHVADLLRVIDAVEAPELVLVGHGYGIHPALGAADLRAERIARIVYLDAGLPQDGESVLDLLPDPGVRDRLRQRAEQTGAARLVPPPTQQEWPFGGSVAGVPAEALERLVAAAAPQPLGTFTAPLRLTGKAAGVPTTGILCTANGSNIAVVQMLLDMGEPRLQPLADPRVGLFELATGHWPMLSCPEELAGVLLRAAAGEGQRLTPPQAGRSQTFLLDLEERSRERDGRLDLYLPDERPGDLPDGLPGPAGPRPAVLFVHGGPIPAEKRPTPRDSVVFQGYGRYAAEQGLVGAVVDHRLHALGDLEQAAGDVAAALEQLRADPRVDRDRIALWCFSGGGLLAADYLAAPPPWLRCLALSYPLLAPQPGWGLSGDRFRPAAAVGGAGPLPVVLTRVELETSQIAATVAEFLDAATAARTVVEVIDVAGGRHGFETIDHTEETRQAVVRAFGAVRAHLEG